MLAHEYPGNAWMLGGVLAFLLLIVLTLDHARHMHKAGVSVDKQQLVGWCLCVLALVALVLYDLLRHL